MNIIIKKQRELERRLKRTRQAIVKGQVRAINKTLRSARTQLAKDIGQQVALPASYIKTRFDESKANKNTLTARLKTPSKGIQLRRFFAKQLVKRGKTVDYKPAGIAVKVARRGRQKKIPGAFLIRLRGSGYGIAYRSKGAKKYRVLYGPSVSQIFNTLLPQNETEIYQTFERNMIADINYYVSKVR